MKCKGCGKTHLRGHLGYSWTTHQLCGKYYKTKIEQKQ